MIDRLSYLNDEQYEAVTSNAKYLRVIAGAGSGKTRVLTERIIYLINETGYPFESLVAITFTNKAAKEMRDRVSKVLKEGEIPLISTFHSFCVRFLRHTIHNIGYKNDFTIIDDEDQTKIIKKIIKDLKIDDERITPKSIINFISDYKNSGFSYEVALDDTQGFEVENAKAKVFKKYELYLENNNYLDFDDLILKTVYILENFPSVQSVWSHKYNAVLVDEFQDTNDIQYKLIRLLMNDNTSLFVVGDPDQTIYTWRGANINIILNLKHDFDGVKDIVLNTNYRSTKNILNCANALIKNNFERVEKNLVTLNGEGGKVLFHQAPSGIEEAHFIIDRILELKRKSENKLKYSQVAVLYRSNYYSRDIERALMDYKMPYRIYGGVKFFNRKEIKDAIAFLRILSNSYDFLALQRLVSTLRVGVGAKSLEDISTHDDAYNYFKDNYHTTKTSKFINAIENGKEALNVEGVLYSKILDKMLETSQYYEHLREDREDERIENIQKGLLPYFDTYQKDHPEASLNEVLQDIMIYSAQDEIGDEDVISLMTIHTAKGLEFDYVFVIGLQEGVFPPSKTIIEQRDDLIEEERRLAYVAFTRARLQLILSCSVGFMPFLGRSGTPSRFMAEIKGRFEYYNRMKDEVNNVKYTPKRPSLAATFTSSSNMDYNLNDRIEHKAYGTGTVIVVDASSVTIKFDDPVYGEKKISKKFTGIKKV